MRNYFKAKWIKADIYDPGNVFVQTVYGPNCFGWNGNSQIDALLAIYGAGYTAVRSPATTYVLVSPDWIMSYLVVGGLYALVVGSFTFDAMKAAEVGLVGDATTSPKHAPLWGYKSDIKKVVKFTGKNVLGKQTMDLQTYLYYLYQDWLNGIISLVDDVVITTFAPQRWLEWLTLLRQKVLDGKLTPTQVYAALALVDFSTKPPTI
jgi:hypothetical protein